MANPSFGSFTPPAPPVKTATATVTAATGPVGNVTKNTESTDNTDVKKRTRATTQIDHTRVKDLLSKYSNPNVTLESLAKEFNITVNQVEEEINSHKKDLRTFVKEQDKKDGLGESYKKRLIQARGKEKGIQNELDDYTQAITERAKKLEQHIQTNLTRPGAIKKGNVELKSARKNMSSDVLRELGIV